MTILNKVSSKTLMPGITPIPDVPDAPTIGAATAVDYQSATVAFTAAATGGAVTTYTATSTPGSITGTSATSPITISGLTASTSYTFKVKGTNATATGAESAASSSITTSALPVGFNSIATYTVGSGGSTTLTFSSIPATYKHLQLRVSAQDNRNTNADSVRFALNGDMTDANFYSRRLIGYSGGALSQNFTNTNGTGTIGGGNYSNVFGVSIFDIFDYQNTNKYKTVRTLSGVDTGVGGEAGLYSMVWMSTSVVSSLTLTPSNGTHFSQYSSFALYGIQG